MRKEILGWIETIAVAVLLAFLIKQFFLVYVYVSTSSMEKTIIERGRKTLLPINYFVFCSPQGGDGGVYRPDGSVSLVC